MGQNDQVSNELTVREKFSFAVKKWISLEGATDRQDSIDFQKNLAELIEEFSTLQSITTTLSFFSNNEQLNEINTSYIPFAALSYYQATLYQKLLGTVNNGFQFDPSNLLEYKSQNLLIAKQNYYEFLMQMYNFGCILTDEQSKILNSFSSFSQPTNKEILVIGGNAASKRAQKIANYKSEQLLQQKLAIINDYYSKYGDSEMSDGEESFASLDEEVIRTVYIDQLKLFSLKSLHSLEEISMELEVLANRPSYTAEIPNTNEKSYQSADKTGYTSKLERNPNVPERISSIISKQGKILQPFVITPNKQDLKRKVFGTGQVLPSMSVEEYLDYELANGKLLKTEAKNAGNSASDEDDENDSEEERRIRVWDDWKDDNPKGSGNTKANIG